MPEILCRDWILLQKGQVELICICFPLPVLLFNLDGLTYQRVSRVLSLSTTVGWKQNVLFQNAREDLVKESNKD